MEFGQGQPSCPVYFLAEEAQHSRRFASGSLQSIGGVEAIADSLFVPGIRGSIQQSLV